jgi:hypothetical protein
LRQKCRVSVLSGWQIQHLFIGIVFAAFHPDGLAQFYSSAKLLLHFVGDLALLRSELVRIFFGDCQSFHSGYNILKMGLVFTFEQEGWRSASAANTACTRQVGLCAFSSTLRGFKFSRFQTTSTPAHLRVTLTVRRFLWTRIKL